ncbi:MAG: FAD-dependent oxidoreductase [Dehalococcoidia bacterium]
MNVAVIGGGVSGLVTAYLLQREHRVELFERERRAGGHANTVVIEGPSGEALPLDVGFIVYNERTYPAFTRLLAELEVETQPSEMSFSLRDERTGLEFSSRGARGYLAQRRNALNPRHIQLLLELLRFHRDARRAIARDTMHDVSFGEYLDRKHFSRHFQERLIVPLTAATWSNAPADIVRFPANYLFRFLEQHGILAPNSIPDWRWLRGGSRSYVQKILSTLSEGAIHLGEAPSRIERALDGVTITFGGHLERRFDAVVLACHPDQALSLLADPSSEEVEALSGFRYAPNRVVLHTDERLLPRRSRARASWNYLHAQDADPAKLTMTYDLNRLQRMVGDTHYCVSVNPGDRVDPARVLAEFDYEHPVYSMATLEAQRRIERINGARRTFFAGAYLGYGFHEDGVQAGARVASKLGVDW